MTYNNRYISDVNVYKFARLVYRLRHCYKCSYGNDTQTMPFSRHCTYTFLPLVEASVVNLLTKLRQHLRLTSIPTTSMFIHVCRHRTPELYIKFHVITTHDKLYRSTYQFVDTTAPSSRVVTYPSVTLHLPPFAFLLQGP